MIFKRLRYRFGAPRDFATGSLRRMAPWVLALCLGAVCRAGQVKPSQKMQMVPFEGKSPRYIARFFAHPSSIVTEAAIRAMAERGQAAVPLLKQLITDTHPFLRYCAVRTLQDIFLADLPTARHRKDPVAITPKIEQLLQIVKPLNDDPHPVVSKAMAGLYLTLRIDNAATRKMAIAMAGQGDPAVRAKALDIARTLIQDPDTRIKIGMTVSGFPDNTNPMRNLAHRLIKQYKDQPICRQALPALINYQMNIANAIPVRGMFAGAEQVAAMEVLKAQWNDPLEKMPDAIGAICRTFVRSDQRWGVEGRALAVDIFKKMSPAAVPALRAASAAERKWIGTVGDVEFRLVNAAPSREQLVQAVDYLDYVADCLESGKPITKQSPFVVKDKKLYEDKVPDPDAVDLDHLLD